MKTDGPTCHCGEPAIARWHDGMFSGEAYCLDHAREQVDPADRLPEFRDDLTTEDSATTIGEGTRPTLIVPAGLRPIRGPWAAIRSQEALDGWVRLHPEVVQNE